MLNLLSDPYYDMDISVYVVSPIKLSEMVYLSVFYSPLYIFPHLGLSTGGEKGGGGSRGKQHGGGSREGVSLSVRFTIRNVNITTDKVQVTI